MYILKFAAAAPEFQRNLPKLNKRTEQRDLSMSLSGLGSGPVRKADGKTFSGKSEPEHTKSNRKTNPSFNPE